MPKNARETLIDIYDAWRTNNFEWLASYLPADFSHSMNIPTDQFALSGFRQGKTESLNRLREILESFDSRHLDVGKLIVGQATATVDVTTRCERRSTGAWLRTTKKHVWRLEDGWPVSLSELYDLEEVHAFIRASNQ